MLRLFTLMSSIQEFSDSLTTYGLVIEVAVTGEKKTITARSSVQVCIMRGRFVDHCGVRVRVQSACVR